MIRAVAIVLMMCGAAVIDAQAPPYASSIQRSYNTHSYIASKLFNFQTPTTEQRGMVGFISVFYAMASDILSGLSYEYSYSVQQITIDQRKRNAVAERNDLTYILDETLIRMQPIVNLVQTLCNGGGANCDELVDARVRSNPAYYAIPAALALNLGELAVRYDANIPQLERASSQQTERQFLATSQGALKPLITQAATCLRVLKEYQG